MNYTVEKWEKANEPEHPQYGQKYHVKFAEEAQSVEVSRKTEPVIGEVLDGTITNGRFKKTPKPYTPGSPQQRYDGPKRHDNSDGMRQGMCINNASEYVRSMTESTGKILEPAQWATVVHGYANELYKLGDLEGSSFDPITADDLKKIDEEVKDISEAPKSVQEIMGVA